MVVSLLPETTNLELTYYLLARCEIYESKPNWCLQHFDVLI